MFIHFVFVNRKELSSSTEELNINAVLFSYVDIQHNQSFE